MPIYILTSQVSDIRQHLKAHNYPHTVPASDLQYLLQCIARSHPGYEKCKTAELRLFAQQRRLVDIDINAADRKQLAKALRLADQTPTFHLFLKLPSELRISIYRFYCAPFATEPLTLPIYPPLARVNNQLLEEVLPIFYNECTFAAGLTTDIHDYLHSASGAGDSGIPHVLRMQRDTTLFFKSLSAKHLSHIQNLEVTFDSRHPRTSVETFKLRISVPRSGKPGTARVVVHKAWEDCVGCGMLHPWSGREVGTEQLRALERRVEEFVERIQKRGKGENHLVIADVYRLRSMLEAFFEEH